MASRSQESLKKSITPYINSLNFKVHIKSENEPSYKTDAFYYKAMLETPKGFLKIDTGGYTYYTLTEGRDVIRINNSGRMKFYPSIIGILVANYQKNNITKDPQNYPIQCQLENALLSL